MTVIFGAYTVHACLKGGVLVCCNDANDPSMQFLPLDALNDEDIEKLDAWERAQHADPTPTEIVVDSAEGAALQCA